MRFPLLSFSLLSLVLATWPSRAEEGMWTFDNPPHKDLRDRYGFQAEADWLNRLQLASLRFPAGSGAFVSPDGLVLTNHHVGLEFIQQVSGPTQDWVKHGFVARTRKEEVPVPGLVLSTLVSMENVTAHLERAVKPDMDEAKAAAARKGALDLLLKTEEQRSDLVCEPVSLYQGGQTWIYRYKKHRDVRLVMAPEFGIAAFGGDWDNFSWPRHDLDFSLFRVYENGKPYRPPHSLKCAEQGAAYGDLTFVTGHPGRTSRLETLAQMEGRRDLFIPLKLSALEVQRRMLKHQAAQGGEQARTAATQIMVADNAYKVYRGELNGLQDPSVYAQLANAERELRSKVAASPELAALAGTSWDKIQSAVNRLKTITPELGLPGTLKGLGPLYPILFQVLPLGKPLPSKDGPRELGSIQEQLRALQPQRVEDIKAQLLIWLEACQRQLGDTHPAFRELITPHTPEAFAEKVANETALLKPEAILSRLKDAKFWAQGQDSLLVLIRNLDRRAQAFQAEQTHLQEVISEHGARIAQARFALYGTAIYPDATFTLRFSYGRIETYPSAGTLAPPFTTFAGLFDRAAAWGPEAEQGAWALPPRWQERRDKLNLFTPYNFITTHDIIGGNSGSPVVNRRGELVGLVFDGNIESLLGRYTYDKRTNRALCVDMRAILEALEKIYDAGHLARELQGR